MRWTTKVELLWRWPVILAIPKWSSRYLQVRSFGVVLCSLCALSVLSVNDAIAADPCAMQSTEDATLSTQVLSLCSFGLGSPAKTTDVAQARGPD